MRSAAGMQCEWCSAALAATAAALEVLGCAGAVPQGCYERGQPEDCVRSLSVPLVLTPALAYLNRTISFSLKWND